MGQRIRPQLFHCSQLSVEKILTVPIGIFTIGEGVIPNFTGLKALRFFVGVFEARLIPGDYQNQLTNKLSLTDFDCRQCVSPGPILPTLRAAMESQHAHGR